MPDAIAIVVTDINVTREVDSGLMVQFNAKLNGIPITDFKYFTEKGNLLPPSREYESKKTGKTAYWRYVPLEEADRTIVITALKAHLEAAKASKK